MKKSLSATPVILAVLAVLAGVALAQAPGKADGVGTWVGVATVGDTGQAFDITVVIGRVEAGYTAKIGDASGMIPETEMREVALKDNKLTGQFDLPETMGAMPIAIELTLDHETLKGVWFGSDGSSGGIELVLKKQILRPGP